MLFFAQTGSRAAEGDALPYANGFLVTGDYVVGGVDVSGSSVNGFVTAAIPMSGVPANADILAAYLYWETITVASDLSQASGVRFRGFSIDLEDVVGVKTTSVPLTGQTASCWSSGTPLAMSMFRADVLRFLPMRMDKDDTPTAKRLVNTADLLAHGLPEHTVKLPKFGTGNQVPESAGASLLVVYRDPTQPLRKIVVYDGIHVQSPGATTTQTIQGFYKSAQTKSAKLTHMTASGQKNSTERLHFNGSVIAQNPFPDSANAASDRAWATVTFNVTSLMPGTQNSQYGETATTAVTHAKATPYECLSWGAIIFSTAVADADGDGLPDGLEDAPLGFKDPDGKELPNLNAMGASSAQKDLFIEVNAMWAPPNTSYGSPAAPVNSTTHTVTDLAGHHHLPAPQELKMVGDAYAAQGITPHFDVGDIDAYRGLGVVQHTDWVDDYTSTEADMYLVPSHLARGGEFIKETACDPAHAGCRFPDYPGTVGWKLGLPLHRDWPVGDNGEEISLDPADPNYFDWNTGTQRRRFDSVRKPFFHYILYAHARGTPKSRFPCLVNGEPAPYDNGTSCSTNNPEFSVPSSSGGMADLPGGNALVTLGLWDEFVGRPYVRAATTFHELGHNLELWHGGLPANWGNKALNTATHVEPNCKPNYLSSMSYLFQVHGLFDDDDEIHLNYSSATHDWLDEATALTDSTLVPTPGYRPAWFAPADSVLASSFGVSPATRFCSGAKFDPLNPPDSMARVLADSSNASIDWNGDTIIASSGPQDVNFDGASSLLNGFNDWANIRLDQISAGRHASVFMPADDLLAVFGSSDDLLAVFGSSDDLLAVFGSSDDLLAVFGSSDDLLAVFGSSDDLLAVFGSSDDLLAVFGSSDDLLAVFGSGSEQEMTYDGARGVGRAAPHALRACVIGHDQGCTIAPPFDPLHHRTQLGWSASTVGKVFAYHVSRKRGDATAPNPYVPLGTTGTNSFVDTEELPNGEQFTYQVIAEFRDDETPVAFSAPSRPKTITAVNTAPVAMDDAYTTVTNTRLTVSVPGVLGNDDDVDSAVLGTVMLVTPPASGRLTLNANGSFRYDPDRTVGTVTFQYVVVPPSWFGVPMSANSNVATVTIEVIKK